MVIRSLCVAATAALGVAAHAQAPKPAPKPPSFQKDVLPILRTACFGCHSGAAPAGGLATGSFAELMKGGKNGPSVVPGKASQSRLALMLTGAVKPIMPPTTSLKPAEIDAIKRWIDAGAKNDVVAVTTTAAVTSTAAASPTVAVKPIGRSLAISAPVNALAFSPDSKWLAIGTYQRVLICDATTLQVGAVWTGHPDAVRSLAFSPDGKWLAAGGGISGAFGQVKVWSVAEAKEARAFGDHTDAVNGVAYSPDGLRIVSASADKSVKVWEAATGKLQQTLRDHADTVLGVAFHPNGKFLATCSGDKSIKIWDTTSWKRLYSVGQEESVTSVSFVPGGAQFYTTSTDRTTRAWNFGPEGSGEAGRIGGHNASVWSCDIASDGQLIATGAGDKLVQLWNGGRGHVGTLNQPKDWIYSVRFSPDRKRLAAGAFNGDVLVWSVADRKLEGVIATAPTGGATK